MATSNGQILTQLTSVADNVAANLMERLRDIGEDAVKAGREWFGPMLKAARDSVMGSDERKRVARRTLRNYEGAVALEGLRAAIGAKFVAIEETANLLDAVLKALGVAARMV